jgi:hypothetical protein
MTDSPGPRFPSVSTEANGSLSQHSYEASGSVNGDEFVDLLSDYQSFKDYTP